VPNRRIDLTGQQFGRLTVLKRANLDQRGHSQFLCKCSCGNTTIKFGKFLQSGASKSCGCLRAIVESLPVDSVHGRLTVLYELPRGGRGQRAVRCKCSCGSVVDIALESIRKRRTFSCGCLQRELSSARVRTHGKSETSEYRIWVQMKDRCSNPKIRNYPKYGGRGITVCERWKDSFESFYSDMGPRPSLEHSIDRINNDGNYEPGNCRWSTRLEQARNRRNSFRVTYDGVTMSLQMWSEETGIHWKTMRHRLQRGWSTKAALFTPANGERVE
jgi:hypothetical protein